MSAIVIGAAIAAIAVVAVVTVFALTQSTWTAPTAKEEEPPLPSPDRDVSAKQQAVLDGIRAEIEESLARSAAGVDKPPTPCPAYSESCCPSCPFRPIEPVDGAGTTVDPNGAQPSPYRPNLD